MADIKMRGSGELLLHLKARALSLQDLTVFAQLLWAANRDGEARSSHYPVESIKKLISLQFCVRINAEAVLLNPHIAQIGDTAAKRGELRARFRRLQECTR